MDHRNLGRTGLKVSPLCLGAMMFGGWGNPDHDESIAIIHAALDAGINFIDTADVYSAGESEEIVGKAIAGPARRRRARHQVLRPDGRRTRTSPAGSRPLDHAGVRGQPAPARHRPHRPLPDPPARPDDRHRRDARRAVRPRPPGQGPLPRAARPSRRRRSSRRSGWPSGATASGSCASSRRTRSSCGASRPTCSRRASATAWASSRGARSPAGGCRASGAWARPT